MPTSSTGPRDTCCSASPRAGKMAQEEGRGAGCHKFQKLPEMNGMQGGEDSSPALLSQVRRSPPQRCQMGGCRPPSADPARHTLGAGVILKR